MENRYIYNVKWIAHMAKKNNVDWSVAVDLWDTAIMIDADIIESNITELRHEFYDYVSGRKYGVNGDEIN